MLDTTPDQSRRDWLITQAKAFLDLAKPQMGGTILLAALAGIAHASDMTWLAWGALAAAVMCALAYLRCLAVNVLANRELLKFPHAAPGLATKRRDRFHGGTEPSETDIGR